MQKTKSGFTIVELLIVIVVIAILAAITVVAYNGIQERARISSVSSALGQANKKLALYQVENPGQYPANLASIGINDSTVTYQYTVDNSTNPATYCITATTSATSYKSTSTATTPASGGCPGHGQGGVAAITNIATNPSVESNSTGWSYRWYGNTGGAGVNSRQTSGGLYGSSYLRKTWTVAAAAADNGFNTSSNQIAVTAGANYTISGAMRTNRSDVTSARVGVQWYDSTGTQIGATATWSTYSTLTANTWRRISGNFTAPAGATSLVVIFSNALSISWAVNDTYDFDGAMVTEAANSNYADGNTTDWAWSGTVNNSTSTGLPQ